MDGAGGVIAAKGAGIPAKLGRPGKADDFKRALARATEGRGPAAAAVPAWPSSRAATPASGTSPDTAFRARIARAETGATRPGEGYGARNTASGALGRYQFTPLALRDLGWKDAAGGWTALAARHGVGSDAGFLASPAAQETAMGAYLRRAEALLDRNGSLARSGGAVAGLDGTPVPLTEAGLVAAAHRRGAGSVARYLAHRAAPSSEAPLSVADRARRSRPWSGACGTSRNCPTRSRRGRCAAAPPCEERMTSDVRHCARAKLLLSFRRSRDGSRRIAGHCPVGRATERPQDMADLRFGTSGDDTFTAGAEEAIFFGSGGNDSLTGSPEADFLFGNEGNDTLNGNAGDDLLDAGTGDDTVNTGAGDDLVFADAGNDSIGGMAGNDTVFGGRGNDVIAWNDPTGDLVFGDEDDDTIIGGNVAADTIFGGTGDDSIQAFATAPADATVGDEISGEDGNDILLGGDAADTISGGGGDDTLTGNGGDDELDAGAGEDSVNTGLGNDLVYAGAGDDNVGGMAGNDTVYGGAGNDVIAWNDPAGDLAFGDEGNDTIIGGNVAADTISGGSGDDLVRAFATDPEAATAADELSGDGGDDVLLGGDAADTVEGGADDDTMTGNGGADVFVFNAAESTGDDVITDFSRADDTVRLVGFDAGFDPLANLDQGAQGTTLDLGDGDGVLFLGRLAAEFAAGDFVLV